MIYANQTSQIEICQMPIKANTQAQQKINILIADDDFFMQKLLAIQLQSLGYSSVVVDNGAAAMLALKKHRYDLLFLDVVMPEMDGLEVLIAIRKLEYGTANHLPIVMVTGHSEPEDIQKLKKLGADACIAKPIKKDQLISELHTLLKKY